MEILPKLTRFRINGLQISSFYTLNNVLDKETENIFQTPQGTVKRLNGLTAKLPKKLQSS